MQIVARHAAKYFDVEIVREVEFAPLDVVRIEHDGVRTVIAHAYSEERARELANELWLEGMGRTAETVTAPVTAEPVTREKIPTSFAIGERVTMQDGTWVELTIHQHPSNFYHVYGFTYWSPSFAAHLGSAESATHMNRAKIERQMASHLRGW